VDSEQTRWNLAKAPDRPREIVVFHFAVNDALKIKNRVRMEQHVSDHQNQKPPVTTTDAGIPASSDEYSLSVGPNGPLLLQDHYVIQKMAQFNR
jgi:hypothetical protein